MRKQEKGSFGGSVIGPHTQLKCLLKALIFGTCEKNILLYPQMRYHIDERHRYSATGLKSGTKSINWVCVGIYETIR